MATSEFLLRSDGGDDIPDAGGAVPPTGPAPGARRRAARRPTPRAGGLASPAPTTAPTAPAPSSR